VYDANRPREFAAETSFQAQVKIVDQSSGQVVDYTGSPRVQYDETFGCATASNLGVITMTPMTGTPCAGSPEYPVVMILLVDASGQAIAATAISSTSSPARPRRDEQSRFPTWPASAGLSHGAVAASSWRRTSARMPRGVAFSIRSALVGSLTPIDPMRDPVPYELAHD